MALTLRPERPEDLAAARRVHERAFSTPAEADLVDALRAEGAHVPEICLVALRDEQVVGHVVFSRARLVVDGGGVAAAESIADGAAGTTPLLVLAPLAVDPAVQRNGIGATLVREALRRAAAAAAGVPLVSVLGHADYYSRFGFELAGPLGIRAPFEVPADAWMALRLPAYPRPDQPRPEGVIVYADAFAAVS